MNPSMASAFRGALVFYTQQMKFLVVRNPQNHNQWSFPIETITEIDDSYSTVLGLSRHLYQNFTSQFVPSMLSSPPPQQGYPQTTSPPSSHQDEWITIWRSLSYNEWLEFLSEKPFYSIRSSNNEKRFDVYLAAVSNQDHLVENLTNLSIPHKFLSQHEILTSQEISQDTKELFYVNTQSSLTSEDLNASIDLSEVIALKEKQMLAPYSRTNTVILLLHKATTTREQFMEIIRLGAPRMPTKALYTGIFRDENERWITYDASTGVLPSEDVLANVKALVLPGSSNSAYSTEPWVVAYRNWLKNAYKNHVHLRFLGICFGEQVLAMSLGGTCGKTKGRLADPYFYDCTVQKLKLSNEFLETPYVKKLGITQNELWISKAHGDEVTSVDENVLQVVGSSEKYGIEVLINKESAMNPRFLAIQGHPEYASTWAIRKNTQFESFIFKVDLYEQLKKAQDIHDASSPSDHFILREICRSFLRE